jgi:hypothetical protein
MTTKVTALQKQGVLFRGFLMDVKDAGAYLLNIG